MLGLNYINQNLQSLSLLTSTWCPAFKIPACNFFLKDHNLFRSDNWPKLDCESAARDHKINPYLTVSCAKPYGEKLSLSLYLLPVGQKGNKGCILREIHPKVGPKASSVGGMFSFGKVNELREDH